MNALLTSISDLFLPRLCYNCGNNLNPYEKLFCASCFKQIKRVSPELLEREYERKFAGENIIAGFQSLFVFVEGEAVQKCIHKIKYSNSFATGNTLGAVTAGELAPKIKEWNCDLIVPVPIHRTRRAERGYNQSFYIARGISRTLNIPVKNNIIKRNRYTSTQTKLNLAERKMNVSNAFIVKNKDYLQGKRIILVDDVITTGATITECGKVLIASGAEKVYALSVALAE